VINVCVKGPAGGPGYPTQAVAGYPTQQACAPAAPPGAPPPYSYGLLHCLLYHSVLRYWT